MRMHLSALLGAVVLAGIFAGDAAAQFPRLAARRSAQFDGRGAAPANGAPAAGAIGNGAIVNGGVTNGVVGGGNAVSNAPVIGKEPYAFDTKLPDPRDVDRLLGGQMTVPIGGLVPRPNGPWHAGYMDPSWGRPLPLVVPPTARLQTEYGWGIGNTRITRINPQFTGPHAGHPYDGQENWEGAPYWPSDTQHQGVYYIRGPWTPGYEQNGVLEDDNFVGRSKRGFFGGRSRGRGNRGGGTGQGIANLMQDPIGAAQGFGPGQRVDMGGQRVKGNGPVVPPAE